MKIQHLFLIVGCFYLSLTTSCKDDESGPVGATTAVTINFKATYGDEPFILITDEFMYPDGKMIRFQEEFGLFISNIELLQAEGNDKEELKEIEYLDFGTNSSPAFADIPQSITIENIPVGEYKGIKFNIGVPSDLNAETPNEFGGNSPLSDPSVYWADWNSYTFLRLDGCYDRDGMGLGTSCNIAGGDNTVFTFHTGGNAAFREMDAFVQDVTLTENQTTVFNFEIDVSTIIGANGELIDFGAGASLHTNNIDSPDDLALINKLMDNTANGAITIKN